MSIWTQKSASIQKRTSPLKFDDSAEKSEKSSVSNLSTKVLLGGERTEEGVLGEGFQLLAVEAETSADALARIDARRRATTKWLQWQVYHAVGAEAAAGEVSAAADAPVAPMACAGIPALRVVALGVDENAAKF